MQGPVGRLTWPLLGSPPFKRITSLSDGVAFLEIFA